MISQEIVSLRRKFHEKTLKLKTAERVSQEVLDFSTGTLCDFQPTSTEVRKNHGSLVLLPVLRCLFGLFLTFFIACISRITSALVSLVIFWI